MPIPAAIIGAGIAAAASGAQVYAQGKMNKKTREFAEYMYGRQRQDALDDYNRINEYNSPAAMMQRYEDAGLNKNLIYGQTNEAAPVRSSSAPSWNPETPDYRGLASGAIQGLEAFQDFTLQSEQIKNMQRMRENMEMDTLLKSADLYQKNLDHDIARELRDTTIQTAMEKLNAMRQDMSIKLSEEERKVAMHAPSLEAAIQNVANMKGQGDKVAEEISLLKQKGVLQKMEIAMREKGLSYGDNVILRVLSRLAEGESLSDLLGNLWRGLTN